MSIPGSKVFLKGEAQEPNCAIIHQSPLRVHHYGFCEAPSVLPPLPKLQAIFSPSAPQVENNMLDRMTCESEGAQDLHAPKGCESDQEPIMRRETRSVNHTKNLKIPTLVELSDSDDGKHSKTLLITNHPYGLAFSPHAFLGQVQRRRPLTKLNTDRPAAAQGRRLAKYKETSPTSYTRCNYEPPAGWDEGYM